MALASSRHTSIPFLLSLLAAFAAPAARAAVWHVLPDGGGDFPTIQAAVDGASNGDEILLGGGTFTGEGNREITYGGRELTIRSASGDAADCIIDLGAEFRTGFVFTSADGSAAVVRDLTISGGRAYSVSAAGDPTIENVMFTAFEGEAVRVQGGAPVIRGATFRDGSAPAYRSTYGSCTFSDCLFESNLLTASRGVIEMVRPGDARLERCAFRGNAMSDGTYGLLMNLAGGSITLTDCEILDNGVPAISAIGNGALTLVLDGCLLEGNTSGIYLSNSYYGPPTSLLVHGCTIRSHLSGTGIHVGGDVDVTVEDTTIERNRDGIGGHAWSSDHQNYLSMANCRILDNRDDGIDASFPMVTLAGCEVRGNGGRGISLFPWSTAPSSLSMERCLVAGNGGRGMELDGITGSVLETSTIAGNGGTVTGGGVRFLDGSNLTMRHCIVWDNCSPDDSDALIGAGCSIQFECTVVDPARVLNSGSVAFTGAIFVDPLFCLPDECGAQPSLDGDYRLDPSSAALHAACGPIGATGEGCSVISVVPSTWAHIKARYR